MVLLESPSTKFSAPRRPSRSLDEAVSRDGLSPRPPCACKPGTELGAAPTLAVPNPDSRLGLSPHSQGRVWTNLPPSSSAFFLEKELAEVDRDIGQAIKTSPVWREAEALRCETLEQPAVDEDAVIARFEKVT